MSLLPYTLAPLFAGNVVRGEWRERERERERERGGGEKERERERERDGVGWGVGRGGVKGRTCMHGREVNDLVS